MNQKLSLGSMLGPYKVLRLIGKGGMGEVYEAYEELLHRKVALKIIAADEIDNDRMLDLFIREGKALAQMNHPNVVTIYQLGHANGIHYIAMEYIEGLSLDEFIATKRPDVTEALKVFYKILLGTEALHKKGIIHRDLKPKNIIIQDGKNVKIVDFGIAQMIRDDQTTSSRMNGIMGSIYYLAPEIIQGQAATFQSDIWSLGIILYQLLTRQRPFTGSTQDELVDKILGGRLTFSVMQRFLIPDQVQLLNKNMCHRSLDGRYQSVREIRKDIYDYLNSKTTDSLQQVHSKPVKTDGFSTDIKISNLSFKQRASGLALLILLIGPFAYQFVKKLMVGDPSAERSVAAIDHTEPLETKENLGEPGLDQAETPEQPLLKTKTAEPDKTEMNRNLKPSTVQKKSVVKPARPATASRPPLERARLKNRLTEVILNWETGQAFRSIASAQDGLVNFPVLFWHSVNRAKAYQLQLSYKDDFSKLIINTKVDETYFRWEKPFPGKYYWRVRALSNSKSRLDGEFSQPGVLQVQLPEPRLSRSQYQVTAPAAKTSPHRLMVQWEPLPLAKGYEVVLSREPTMKSLFDRKVVTQNKAFLQLPGPGLYYFNVTALGYHRQPASQASATGRIHYRKASQVPAPNLQQPMDGIAVPTQGTMISPIAFRWSGAREVSRYQFQLASDERFQRVAHEVEVHENKYVLTTPLPRGRFFWRVRAASKENDVSEWSEVRIILID